MSTHMWNLRSAVIAMVFALAAGGCASSNTNTPGDPFEGFNRALFGFNDAVDNAVLKPVATGYRNVVPEPVRECTGNVFANINDVFVAVNSLLQGKVGDAVSDACRVLVNTTVGVLGCFDVASKIGLEKHNRDFGQTFGKWGIASGPYLVLPFLGPSSFRDGVGTLIYSSLDPVWANHIPTRNVAYSLRAVNTRSDLLSASSAVEDAALDKYAFVRDAYVQRRQSLVDDGENKSHPRSDVGSDVALAFKGKGARGVEAPLATEAGPLPASVWFDEANQRGGIRMMGGPAANKSASKTRTLRVASLRSSN